jgi:hypothetical protein
MMLRGPRSSGVFLGVCLAVACAVSACEDDAPAGSTTVDARPMDANGGGGGAVGTGGAAGNQGGAAGNAGGAGGTGGAVQTDAGAGDGAAGSNTGGAGGAGGGSPADASDVNQAETSADAMDAPPAPDAGAPDGGSDAPVTVVDAGSDTAVPVPAICAAAKEVGDGSLLENEPLGLATQNGAGTCGNAPAGPTLYYTATVQPGQLLTLQVWPEDGDRTWVPFVRVFAQCDQGTCPSRGGDGRTAGDGVLLNYANTTDTAQKMFIEVSAVGAPVDGATFAMDVSLIDSKDNGECDLAEMVGNGDMLTDQFQAHGTGAAMLAGQCAISGTTPALFYSVDLPAHKTLHVVPRTLEVNLTQPTLHFVVLDGGCDATSCQSSATLNLPNTTDTPKTIVFGVAGASADPLLFDLDVSFTP